MTLADELELAAMDQLDGGPPGPLLAGRIQRACNEVLRRHGVRGRVTVRDGGQRVHVEVHDGPRVRTVQISLGQR